MGGLPSIVGSPFKRIVKITALVIGSGCNAPDFVERKSRLLRSLILEDDAESRAAISTLVRLQGFETFEAGTLAEARQCVSQQSMDVALVDLSLPDGSGLEIVRDIQRHSGGGGRSSW